jgi:predicted nucleic acid-binding Zn ribbon protein
LAQTQITPLPLVLAVFLAYLILEIQPMELTVSFRQLPQQAVVAVVAVIILVILTLVELEVLVVAVSTPAGQVEHQLQHKVTQAAQEREPLMVRVAVAVVLAPWEQPHREQTPVVMVEMDLVRQLRAAQ